MWSSDLNPQETWSSLELGVPMGTKTRNEFHPCQEPPGELHVLYLLSASLLDGTFPGPGPTRSEARPDVHSPSSQGDPGTLSSPSTPRCPSICLSFPRRATTTTQPSPVPGPPWSGPRVSARVARSDRWSPARGRPLSTRLRPPVPSAHCLSDSWSVAPEPGLRKGVGVGRFSGSSAKAQRRPLQLKGMLSMHAWGWGRGRHLGVGSKNGMWSSFSWGHSCLF